jgi:hypothetical protein
MFLHIGATMKRIVLNNAFFAMGGITMGFDVKTSH